MKEDLGMLDKRFLWIVGLLVCWVSTQVQAEAGAADITREKHAEILTTHMTQLEQQDKIFQMQPAPSIQNSIDQSKRLYELIDTTDKLAKFVGREYTRYAVGSDSKIDPVKYVEDFGKSSADIDASLLLKPTIVDPKNESALLRLVRNLSSPFPSNLQRIRRNSNDENGQNILTLSVPNGADDKTDLAKKRMLSAVRSVAANTLIEQLSMRVADKNDESLLSLMEEEATWRYRPSDDKDVPSWFERVATLSESSLLREQAHMQAYQLWMSYQQYRQLERIEALLAASISSQTYLAEATQAVLKNISGLSVEEDTD